MLLWKRALPASLILGLSLGGSAFAAGLSDGAAVARNTPKFVKSARIMGKVDPETIMDVSIWLKPHDQAGFDALAKELYEPTSPKFRHWLTKAEYSARFAPTAAEAGRVAQFFAAHNMKVVRVGPDNFFVRATGTAATVSAAFHISLNNYEVNGKTVRANSEDPYIEGEAAPLVRSVAGLDTIEYTHPIASWKSSLPSATRPSPASAAIAAALRPKPEALAPAGLKTEALAAGRPKADTAETTLPASDFNRQCFIGGSSQNFTTDGSLPVANYQGLTYTKAAGGCGYTPETISNAYNLKALYAQHLDGTGQTIVILDWCGSPTILSDANAFSAQFGLPALTSKNFQIINTPTPSYCAGPDGEINLDVEWAHAIAPGANINLVVPPSPSNQDIAEGLFYAVDYHLGNVISGSFGIEELADSPTDLETEDLIAEIAAVMGISENFSTGDEGDFTFDYPEYYSPSVSSPADSPYATAVGGITLSLTGSGAISFQTGWGTNENTLSFMGEVTDPPSGNGFFNGGSGGGESGLFAKPSFQNSLPGNGRQLPDISWLADPFTGAYIAISEPGSIPELQYESVGGTSLACPMFSALWAIANQAAGMPLGQAAPYLYSMPKGAITDMLPYSVRDVKGTITDASGTTSYTPADLAQPLENTTTFVSAIWDYPLYEDTAILVTFGTDSGLTITPGWDNVTGMGVPNPVPFIEAFKP